MHMCNIYICVYIYIYQYIYIYFFLAPRRFWFGLVSPGSSLCYLRMAMATNECATAGATRAGGSFAEDVWPWVKEYYEEWAKLPVLTRDEGAVGTVITQAMFEKNFEKSGEMRQVVVNLAWFNPTKLSLSGEVLTVTKSMRAAKGKLYLPGTETLQAPDSWPQAWTLPVVAFNTKISCKEGPLERNGGDHGLAGFWYAVAQAAKLLKAEYTVENIDRMESFRKLCRNGVADFILYKDEAEAKIACWQRIVDVEEDAELNGFTGFRKVHIAQEAVLLIMAAPGGGKSPNDEVVAEYIKKTVRISDVRRQPTKTLIRDLRAVGKAFLLNTRAMGAVQIAEAIWGRMQVFDEMSKLVIISQRSRGVQDLAFMCEFLTLRMQLKTLPGAFPVVFTAEALSKKEVKAMQLARDFVNFITQKRNWNPPTAGKALNRNCLGL